MSGRMQKKVDPRVAGLVLVLLIGGVQVYWFKGLLQKKPPIRTDMRAGGPLGQLPPQLSGRSDVRVETVAGEPEPGLVDGPGYAARFDSPTGIAVLPDGNLVVADSRNHRIRLVDAQSGKTSTLAGSGPGDQDGPATSASFRYPTGVAVGTDGAVYVTDSGNHRIRRVARGNVSTVAGSSAGMADGNGSAARFDTPTAIAVDPNSGLVWIADTGNKRLRKMTPAGAVSGGTTLNAAPTAVAWTPSGAIVGSASGLHSAGAAAGRSISAPMGVVVKQPLGVAVDKNGVYVVDSFHSGVFQVSGTNAELLAGYCEPSNRVTNWIDDQGNRARFGRMAALVADGNGKLYVCDTTNNAIRRLWLPGTAPEEGKLP